MHLFCWMNKYSILWIMQSGFILVRSDCCLVFLDGSLCKFGRSPFALPSLPYLSPQATPTSIGNGPTHLCVPFISLLFLASLPSFLPTICLHVCISAWLRTDHSTTVFFLKFTLIWQPLFDEIYLFPHYFALLSFPPLPLTIVLAISSYSNCSLIFIFI